MRKFFIYFLIFILFFIPCTSFATDNLGNTTDVQSKIDAYNLQTFTEHVLLVEKETGDILYEKNAYEKMYPASTTKILTAILVLENCNLTDIVTVSDTALLAVPKGYTTAHLQVGEEFTVEELLYAMLIPSANDVANVLAEHVSGSIANFSNLMNEKAMEIGLTNSNFTNPSGIQDENLYTTAYDLSLLARYAMNNEKFREIVSTSEYSLPATNIHQNNDRVFQNSNLLINKNNTTYYYPYATGIKTGFTDEAGDCLVASAKKDDVEFIAVCLKSSTREDGTREKFLDSKNLFNFAFDNYTTYYKELQEKSKEKENNFNLFDNEELVTSDTKNTDTLFQGIRYLVGFGIIIIVLIVFIKLIFKKKSKKKKRR